jgi:hypothetical protein
MLNLQESYWDNSEPLAKNQRVRLVGHLLFFGSNRRLALLFWPPSDLLTLDVSDDSDSESDDAGNTMPPTIRVERRQRRREKLGKHGIELKPCKHVFCGVSLSLHYREFELNRF